MPFPRSRTSPAMTVPEGDGACFPLLLAPNKGREIGGGRATRQPGQVRKEAALTRSGSGRSSVSYLFFERIAPAGFPPARSFPQKPAERDFIADRPMTDAGAPPASDSASQAGFALGAQPGTPYRVLARKYRPSSF